MSRILTTLLLAFLMGSRTAAAAVTPVAAETTATVSTGGAAPATRRLQAVRLRPTAEAFRLIFLFDRPVPYTLHPAGRHATLEFMNAALDSLPAELARVGDPRLSGVWLKQHDGGLVTLELRFPTEVRLDHFALEAPPAVVIDIMRPDQAAVVTAAPEETTLVPQPGAQSPTPPPDAQVESIPAVPLTVGHQGSALPAMLPAQTPPAPKPAEPKPALHRGEIEPLDADYDFFPIGALKLNTPGARAIREQLLARRWATVLRDGLAWLEKNKVGEDTAGMLYMIAEARWQLSMRKENEPLNDVINFYQQAARADGHGDLGAFAAWRQSQAFMLSHDFNSALDCARHAAASSQPAVRNRAVLTQIQSLESLRRFDDALAAIEDALAQTSVTSQLVSLHVKAGNLLTEKGDYTGAWEAYARATRLDDKWISLDKEGGRCLARTAMETGNLNEARAAAEYVNNNFPAATEEKLSLLLLYAEILARQGDVKAAEESYYKMLKELPTRTGGIEVMQRLFALHPDELLDGQSRYCMLLAEGGKVREAMADLSNAYTDALRAGGPVDRLNPALRVVAPLFMEQAVAQGKPFEAVETWKHYGHTAKDPALRRRCLAPLAAALEALEMYDEALRLVRELRQAEDPAGDPFALKIQEARLCIKTANADEAIPLLEDLEARAGEPERQAEVLELLAEACLKAGSPLEAAQVLQALAEAPGCPAVKREQALLQAGGLFLDARMPLQSVELGLKGLLIEKRELEANPGALADPIDGNAFRMMLARAYAAMGDLARQKIVLEDLLARPGLGAERKAEVQILLTNNQRLTGRLSEAEELYLAISADGSADPNWRRTAQQMQKILEWNRSHPDHAIDVTTPKPVPAPLAQAGATSATAAQEAK